MPSEDQQRTSNLPDDFLRLLNSVKTKRAKTVIDHILEHGSITTEDLRDTYGYNHPPRAARDVRELGIPLETFNVTGSDGRQIGAYRFGDPNDVRAGQLRGRQAWPKNLKSTLVETLGSRCGIFSIEYEPRYLQIDHRVPYEVAGDDEQSPPEEFMLLCGSCNRAKSWSCEHCRNWTDDRLEEVCRSCYWATPSRYDHVALRLVKRLELIWAGHEVGEHEELVRLARYAQQTLPDFVKQILRNKVEELTDEE